jgi:diadenosine tetraphosphate (Ap4A) HIT family hydrolase
MRPRVPGCSLCLPDQLEPQLLAETRTFSLAADRRPLVDGHLVLLPREHLPRFAALPAEREAELRELLGWVEGLLAREAGPATVLEYAAPGAEAEHAHAHVVPHLAGGALEDGGGLGADGPADLAAAWERWGGYLWVHRQGRGVALPPARLAGPGLRAWLAATLDGQRVAPPAAAGREAARRWRRGWQRFQRDTRGPAQGIVTSFLRRDGRICILKRSTAVESAVGKWHGVSGYLPLGMDPLEQALEEILEETGLAAEQLSLAWAGTPIPLGEPVERPPWLVYPFLFDLLTGEPRLNWEHQALAWIDPAELGCYDTVPWLDLVYRAVAPRV